MTSFDKETEDVLLKLTKIFKEKDINFVLVGALVPIILAQQEDDKNSEFGLRETRDIDNAISVDSWDEFELIKKELIKNGFTTKKGSPEHRLHHGTIEVDLLPVFGKIAEGGTIEWPETRNIMKITGFLEALEFAEVIQTRSGLNIKVAPIWAFAILKVFAYSDRKDGRDVFDLINLLKSYGRNDERLFDLVPKDIAYENAGAYLCGFDVARKSKKKTIVELKECLSGLLSNKEYSMIISDALREQKFMDNDDNRSQEFNLLKVFVKGIAS